MKVTDGIHLFRVGRRFVLGSIDIGIVIASIGVPNSGCLTCASRLASPAVLISPPNSCIRRVLVGGERIMCPAGDSKSMGLGCASGFEGLRSICAGVGAGSVLKYLRLITSKIRTIT